MKRYLITYLDPMDLQVTHYWEISAKDSQQAKEQARVSPLQRKDGLNDVLFRVEELDPTQIP
jgi:hypothetical protein